MKSQNSVDNFLNNPFDKSSLPSAPFGLTTAKYQAVLSIRHHGALSRVAIADAIGYSASKITSVVNDLIKDNILEETQDGKSTGGRRPREISFNPTFGYIVAVNIGVTKIDIALVDFNEHIRIRRMLPINIKDGPDAILRMVCDFLMGRIEQLDIPVSKIYAFTVTVPGAVKPNSCVPYNTPLMPGWGDYQIDSVIRQNFPYAVVNVSNDANAMAYGELRKGDGIDDDNFIYIKIGMSLSAGIILHGAIYQGANGRAGDIGNIVVTTPDVGGQSSHTTLLETLASGSAIAEQAHQATQLNTETILSEYSDDALTARDVGTAASEGDVIANRIIEKSGQIIGESLANLVTFFDPGVILMGGGVSNIGHQFLTSVRRSILDRSPSLLTQNLRIEIAPLGSEASLIGAIAMALESVFVLEQ